ncbi:MAG: SAM-dependent methyltransferase [Labedaea sp.]
MHNAQLSEKAAVDLEHPDVVRVHDYLLDGTAHWAVDREFGEALQKTIPEFKAITMASRMFVARVIRHLAKLGVRQFLDLGSGVLTAHNTHQIADDIDPHSRVVYVVKEPVALAHAEILLDEEGDPDRHAVIRADLRDATTVLAQAQATEVFTPHDPVAVLMFSVLHILPPGSDGTDVVAATVADYRRLLPSGSYLGVSHLTDDGIPPTFQSKLVELQDLCADWHSSGVFPRSRAQINALLGDFELVAPGMDWIPCWNPEDECPRVEPVVFDAPNHALLWGGLGRKA